MALHNLAATNKIHSYIPTHNIPELDGIGIDFLVGLEPDWLKPLQVKSSQAGSWGHYQTYGRKIPCVVVEDHLSDEELKTKVLEALGLSVGMLFDTTPKKGR